LRKCIEVRLEAFEGLYWSDKLLNCGLCNGAVSSSDYIALNGRMVNELARMWKEVVMVCFEALTWNSPGGLRKITTNFSQDTWCPIRDLYQTPPKYKSEVLRPKLTCSVN
jgi:hypothetical protein